MSDHVLLNLLKELVKSDKMRGLAFNRLFTTSLINSIIQEHKCKILFIYDIEIILKFYFWCE